MQNTKPSVIDFFKGMAMGTIDIVPGVSGSTVAVLLKIYSRFISALRHIDAELLKGLWTLLKSGFSADKRRDFAELMRAKDLPWLLTLLAGLATAFVIASFIIPVLMQRYPVIMRGFFFGLVLGSIVPPLIDLRPIKWLNIGIILVFALGFYLLLGQQFVAPNELVAMPANHADTVESICKTAACLLPPSEVISLPENAHLLTQLGPNPSFEAILQTTTAALPEQSQLFIPQTSYYYCFFGGFVAICAMLLPGISGSFVLLVLGLYYFMLNTIKTFIAALAHGDFYGLHFFYALCFAAGALLGVALFSRALNWLFEHHKGPTLAAIVGILLGCLRAIWPFRQGESAALKVQNILPSLDTPGLMPASIAIIAGLGIVAISIIVSKKSSKTPIS